jgi:hypothetical protein
LGERKIVLDRPVPAARRVLKARRRIPDASFANASEIIMRTTCLAALLSAATVLCIAPSIANSQSRDNPAPSAESCPPAQAMTSLQRRIVAKAAQGPDALRDFIYITRGVYQLDMESTAAWLEEERDSQRACRAAMATPR